MYCTTADLQTESDVEQKLLWPLLTGSMPNGTGYSSADVLTKASIRGLEIGKGSSRKLYYPDYLVVLSGLPVLVVEAKAPGHSLDQALSEARLYANEINSLFPANINPCARAVVCNGTDVHSAPVDTATPDVVLKHSDISAGSLLFADLLAKCSRSVLQQHADNIKRRFRKTSYRRAISLVGGHGFQNEELPPNTFGATIVGDYGHVFNPRTREDRARIVREAYVPSLRRQRYVEPIDRLIRNAVIPATSRLPILEDTSVAAELSTILRDRKNLEHEVLLLVGSVGSGKSTFVDYISEVALSQDLQEKTVWARVNLNDAPLSTEIAYNWIARSIINELQLVIPNEDIDSLPMLQKILGPELNVVRRGAISLLDPHSSEYKTRLADEILKLQKDDVAFAKCLARHVCGGPGKLLVVVLDNCDKRTRDEQLTMFQIAQWVRTEFKCLVMLPLRDVTFDRHRSEPPLDTALKGLTFRIEPPPFIGVLQNRVRLALNDMQEDSKTASTLAYVLPNGMRVSYPAADQSLYLTSILKSLYAHDRFVRKILTGLAGRDVRRALEIFLDFCMSGHIGEDEIYKIRFYEGQYVLPLSIVARVLLRMQRRYYDGDKAYVKNLIQCDPDDALPDHFVRLAILNWLERRQFEQGPAGVAGFHKAETLVRDLVQLGHDASRIRSDLIYMIREGCVIAEHQRMDQVDDSDLIRITASGLVHLQLMANPEYLAACAEDTFLSDTDLADRIAIRITSKGLKGQFSRTTTAKNAAELVGYLKACAEEKIGCPEVYLDGADAKGANMLREAEAAIGATEIEISKRLYVGNLPPNTTNEELQLAFTNSGLTIREIVTPPRAAGSAGKWFSIVEMADGKSAIGAIDLPALTIQGRQLLINEAYRLSDQIAKRGNERIPKIDVTERLFITGLTRSTSEERIRSLFQKHGLQPIEVHLPRSRSTGQVRGYGFVRLSSQSEAAQAIGALNGLLMDGSSLTVRPARPR